jgi:glycine hydroxymethyltransferase
MKEEEMKSIGEMIAEVLNSPNSEEVKSKVRREVAELTGRFPLYPRRYRGGSKDTANA